MLPRYRITTRSATANTSLRLWETTSTATPCEASRLIRLNTVLVCDTPSAAVGSSMITSFAFAITALATATDCRWPPDSDATGWRIDLIVLTESSSSVCLALVSIFASSSNPRSRGSWPRNMFWTMSRLSASARS